MADPISLADAGSSFNVNQLSVFRIIFIREKATEEFFWNVWNAIHNCSFGKCCRNQERSQSRENATNGLCNTSDTSGRFCSPFSFSPSEPNREKATEKFFWNVRNAIHNCCYGKCCRNQARS